MVRYPIVTVRLLVSGNVTTSPLFCHAPPFSDHCAPALIAADGMSMTRTEGNGATTPSALVKPTLPRIVAEFRQRQAQSLCT
ncbi:MAG: hypothetical protein BWY59_00179 [Verrucomicrobia bacterium ADurb.Bin345]|nr:MAG: hypothetical protein BWY59_00179 [Verrucomicrobia bacterium ADurb.Bin345]